MAMENFAKCRDDSAIAATRGHVSTELDKTIDTTERARFEICIQLLKVI